MKPWTWVRLPKKNTADIRAVGEGSALWKVNLLELDRGTGANEDQEEIIMKKGQTLWESSVTEAKSIER